MLRKTLILTLLIALLIACAPQATPTVAPVATEIPATEAVMTETPVATPLRLRCWISPMGLDAISNLLDPHNA